MPAKKVASSTRKPTSKRVTGGLSVPIYSLAGETQGTLGLPKEIFGSKVNKALLSQAIRVYLNNQKGHFANTKTRSEVKGSTKKIWRQKGTGRARHGAITAPIFVGGGIALGPKFRKVVLGLPKKMKKAALISALSQTAADGNVLGLEGLEEATGKTKQFTQLLSKLAKKSVLIVTDNANTKAKQAVGNIPGVTTSTSHGLNVMEVIRYQTLILTKEAVKNLELRLKGEKTDKKLKVES